MPGGLEQVIGAGIIVLALVDMFATVLYARINMGPASKLLSRTIWWAFHRVAGWFPQGRRDLIFSFCGPVVVSAMVLDWAMLLTVGSALLIHPALGTAVVASDGATPTDFVTALYAGGGSIAVVGASDFAPKTGPFRLLFLLNSVLGLSLISLALTYLMQVYNALQRRNTIARRIDALTGHTGDAAELVAGLGAHGRFSAGYTSLSSTADEVGSVTEAHHFYPSLFYFRFRDEVYSVSRFSQVSLDTVSLIKSGLRDEDAAWFKESAAVTQLWRAALLLLQTLTEHYLPGKAGDSEESADQAAKARWRGRYVLGLRRLRQAGIRTVEDESAGAENYVALRAEWDRYVRVLSSALNFSAVEVDPVTADPESVERRPDFRTRLHSAG
ncbi:MAG: two pore domain potassium channel family protein [Gemmatimonadales bacterium]